MERYFLCVLLGAALTWSAPITLQEALEMAKSSNSQIRAEKAKVEMAESAQGEARSRFMPTVSLSASVTRIDDPIYLDLGDIQTSLGSLAEGVGSAGANAAYSVAYLEAYQKASQAYNQAYNGAIAQGLSEADADAFAKQKLGGTAESIADATGKKYSDAVQQKSDAAKEKIEDAEFRMKVQDELFFNARVTAIWPIFTGLKIYSAYDAAKENVNAKKAAFDMAQNTILMDVATKYGKAVQMWIKAYQIEAGHENDLAIAVAESRKAGIDNIFAWSYRGTETLSWLKSDDPDEVAKVFRKALK